jgi:hypothetical protein
MQNNGDAQNLQEIDTFKSYHLIGYIKTVDGTYQCF